jgi:NADPH:quinone reductase-like Zn-dependent oxidoreductase
VLIRVNSSSCGVTDVVEAGPRPWFPLGPERLLGYNVGGVVASVGAAETRLRVGDAVWTMLGGRGDGSGAWAEYVAAPADGVASLSPSIGMSLVDAATLVGPALTDLFAFQAADGHVAGGCAGDCDGAAPWRTNRNTTAVVVAGSGGAHVCPSTHL